MARTSKTNNRANPACGRSVVSTQYGIVSASQVLAARAGTQILERGGNAVDAAIATNAAMGLMEPYSNGLGGDLFAILRMAKTGEMYGLNASGWAPTDLTPALLQSKGMETMPTTGIYSVTVPGAVAGWEAMHGRFGQLPLADILTPAIYYAENGFPLAEQAVQAWTLLSEDSPFYQAHLVNPNMMETLLIDGRIPVAGEVFRNPDLGRTLRRIAEAGRDGFYRGPVAEAMLDLFSEQGGTMSAEDLAAYESEWVEPISTTYRGWTVSEIGPNTQGIAALMMLNLMEQFPLGDYGFHDAKSLHVMIEAKKLAYTDMLHYVGDPHFSTIPIPDMLDKRHAKARAKLIDPKKARSTVVPSEFKSVTESPGGDTTYLSTIDREGNIVSFIQSNYAGFGSGLMPKGTGFPLQNRGGLFTLEGGRANTLAPRKRPLHTIIPGFMSKGDINIGFGIMGGWNQAQAHAQYVAHIADYGMNIQEAFEAGRFTQPGFSGCELLMDSKVPEDEVAKLKKLGHQIQVTPPRAPEFGWGHAVMSNGEGVHFGGSDPYADGAAIPEAPDAFS